MNISTKFDSTQIEREKNTITELNRQLSKSYRLKKFLKKKSYAKTFHKHSSDIAVQISPEKAQRAERPPARWQRRFASARKFKLVNPRDHVTATTPADGKRTIKRRALAGRRRARGGAARVISGVRDKGGERGGRCQVWQPRVAMWRARIYAFWTAECTPRPHSNFYLMHDCCRCENVAWVCSRFSQRPRAHPDLYLMHYVLRAGTLHTFEQIKFYFCMLICVLCSS